LTQVSIHEAKTHLSRLIEKVLRGEEVVISKRHQPVVRLVIAKTQENTKVLGALRDYMGVLSEGWDARCAESDEHGGALDAWLDARQNPEPKPARSKSRKAG
jgi:prevent-host-death family protein